MAGGGGYKIGIALGDRSVTALVLGRKGAPSVKVAGTFAEGDPQLGGELRRAFSELKSALERKGTGPTDGARVAVALLPPLADTRLIPFPPMRREEVEAVLTRDVARYFLGADRPRAVGVLLPARGGKAQGTAGGTLAPVLAAAAPLALLDSVRDAVGAVGWRCNSFSVAQGGWLAAASGVQGRPAQAVVAMVGATAHLLRLDDGAPGSVRQIPAEDPGAVATALGAGSGPVLVLGDPAVYDPMQRALAQKGWSASRDPEGWAEAEESAAARAGGRGLEVVPPSVREERLREDRRRAGLLLAGSLVLLLAAAGTHLWGARRELAAIQEKRAEIRSEVGPLLLARDSLTALNARVEALKELEASAPIWTRSLVELTALLPRGTYITTFYASGDTVELEAAGTRAGEAIQGLRASGLFEDLRLQGIVERELSDGETVEERFTVRGRIPAAREGGSP